MKSEIKQMVTRQVYEYLTKDKSGRILLISTLELEEITQKKLYEILNRTIFPEIELGHNRMMRFIRIYKLEKEWLKFIKEYT